MAQGHFNEPAWLAKQQAHDWNASGAGAVHEPPLLADHTAHAPGRICDGCHHAIAPDQAARLRTNGNWIHEECPIAW
jgi:hypothetical protein